MLGVLLENSWSRFWKKNDFSPVVGNFQKRLQENSRQRPRNIQQLLQRVAGAHRWSVAGAPWRSSWERSWRKRKKRTTSWKSSWTSSQPRLRAFFEKRWSNAGRQSSTSSTKRGRDSWMNPERMLERSSDYPWATVGRIPRRSLEDSWGFAGDLLGISWGFPGDFLEEPWKISWKNPGRSPGRVPEAILEHCSSNVR